MIEVSVDSINSFKTRLKDAYTYLNIENQKIKLQELEEISLKPDFWDDQNLAKKNTSEMSSIKSDIDFIERINSQIEDMEALLELSLESEDEDISIEIVSLEKNISKELSECEVRSLFADDEDEFNAICSINSGAGGTEACDWAEMLFRMYSRWAEKKGFEVVVEQISPGEEAGYSSISFTVKGRFAYGLLKSERGVHRLVRISPFDSQNRRHTSFASFEAIPDLPESELPKIEQSDLRIDTYRASGAGGQHVNKTDSAVRITHIPTNIVVQCQNQRSQLQNKNRALEILAARLVQQKRQEEEAELAKQNGEKLEVGWGSQIRSYILAPYQLVRDERYQIIDGEKKSICETGNVLSVLDGDINEFQISYLKFQRQTKNRLE